MVRIGGKETNLDHLLVKGERRKLREGKALGGETVLDREARPEEFPAAGLMAGELVLWLESAGEEYGGRIVPALAEYEERTAGLEAGKRLQASLPFGRKANFRLISGAAEGYVFRQKMFNASVSRGLQASVIAALLERRKGRIAHRMGPDRVSPHAGVREEELAQALLASVSGGCFFLGLPGVEVCERLLEKGRLEGGITDSPLEAVYYQENFLPVTCRDYGDFLLHAPRWDFSTLVIPRPEGLSLRLLETVFRRVAVLGFAGEIWLSVLGYGEWEGRPRGAGLRGWGPALLRWMAQRRGFSVDLVPGEHSVLVKVRTS